MPGIPEKTIAEKLNALEIRRAVLRSEVDNPPEKVGVYFFLDREQEIRCLTLSIEAIRDLLK